MLFHPQTLYLVPTSKVQSNNAHSITQVIVTKFGKGITVTSMIAAFWDSLRRCSVFFILHIVIGILFSFPRQEVKSFDVEMN